MNEKYKSLCESLGWEVVEECTESITKFQKNSPAGSQIVFWVISNNSNDFVAGVKAYAESFDVDDYVAFRVDKRGTDGVPSTVRAMVEDAEAIKAMLLDLANALSSASVEEAAENVPHFELPLEKYCDGGYWDCDMDMSWTWYLISDETELDAVRQTLYCNDCSAHEYVPQKYPCWLCFEQCNDGYGDILGTQEQVLDAMHKVVSAYEADLTAKFQANTPKSAGPGNP